MKVIIRILAIVAFFISSLWFFNEGGYEPALTSVVSLSALISTFFFEKEKKNESLNQKQKVGDKSNVIQAGKDVNITINSKRDV